MDPLFIKRHMDSTRWVHWVCHGIPACELKVKGQGAALTLGFFDYMMHREPGTVCVIPPPYNYATSYGSERSNMGRRQLLSRRGMVS